MGITRVKDDLLKGVKTDNNIDFEVVIDENILEHGSYNLPYSGQERIDWELTLEPTISANISIKREDHEVAKFDLNEQNLSKASSIGARGYKRDITLSLNLEKECLLLNGKVCANPHLEDPRGWHCSNYHDVSLFSW
jgi:hypothetical protein